MRIVNNRVYIGNRRVGFLLEKDGKKIFVAPRKRSHYFRKFKGWAIAKEVLDYLVSNNFDEIIDLIFILIRYPAKTTDKE